MAEVRLETYQHYAQPAAFGALYRRAGITVTLALVFGLILFLLLAMSLKGSLFHPPLAGDFYQIFPHNLLAWMFGSVFILAIGLLMAGVLRFWREISPGVPRSAEIAEASHNALTLKYLDGGHGKGCNEADDAFTLMRRRFHHFTFYGFMLCFAWMAILLAIHLGVVMALFLTIPYGKFAHGFYRCAALLKWAIEKRRGKQAGVTGD